MENNGLPDCAGIDYIFHECALNQYVNVKYNNEHHNLHINGNISTSNKSSVSTLTAPSVSSTNDEGCSLFSTLHEKIKYSDLSKTQSRAVRYASDVMKSQIKLLANKTWHSVIIEYFLEDKDTK